jgi:hypothetical protein
MALQECRQARGRLVSLRTSWWQRHIDDPELKRLHKRGMSDDMLVAEMRVSKPTILTHRERLGLPENLNASRRQLEKPEEPGIMVDVRVTFRQRLVEVPGKEYFPVILNELMRVYNRRRKAAGLQQILSNPNWSI